MSMFRLYAVDDSKEISGFVFDNCRTIGAEFRRFE